MSRNFGYDPDANCELCGRQGTFDFYGSLICGKCIEKNVVPPDPEVVKLAEELVGGDEMKNSDAYIHYKDVQKMITKRFKHIINGEGFIIPRIAIKIAVDDFIAQLEDVQRGEE